MNVSRLASLLVAGIVSVGACEKDEAPPPVIAGDAGIPTTSGVDAGAPVDAGGSDGSAMDASDDARACDKSSSTAKRVNITGKILLNGQPHSGLARLRDRRSGALGAEASVNDAGFFLLGGTVFDPAECEDWWIEIENSKNVTPVFSGDLDANGIVRDALASGERDVDISSQPIAVK